MRMALSGSRTEFLATDDTLGTAGNIKYSRTGGCFVPTRVGVVAFLLFLASLLLVGLLVYYLAPCPHSGKSGASAVNGSTSGITGTGEAGSASAGPEGEGAGSNTPATPPADLRLPDAVRPHYYTIWLQPFIGDPATNNFTYKGLVDIEVRCVSEGDACSRISLHAKDLNVSWAEVSLRQLPVGVSSGEAPGRGGRAIGKKYNATAAGGPSAPSGNASLAVPAAPQTVNVTGHSMATEKDMITLTLEKPMEVGRNYSLEIPFWGNVTTSLSGLYRSSYTEMDGTKRWMAVTQFEATSARKAFPCFDEPAMKARFEVHVARRAAASSMSNMPLNRSDPIPEQPGWMWDHYPASPLMSSYLVALVVSELGRKSAPAAAPGSPAFEVAARPDLLPTADYALDIGPRILDHYANYFNVAYPLPKLTMAAVPDFAAGAMENWGLVLYRESLMLFNKNTSTAKSQESVAEVVAHELAHQWFGNLVTMKWWSDLWLNEGFATYVAYIGVNHVEPSWNMLDQIVTEEMHPVLETDSLNNSHPISVPVHNPAQISEAFDEVSYNKGACLIRMLNHSLTEPVFRSGITNYLNKWTWGNAMQDDLWAALTEAAGNASGLLPPGVSVKAVMDTWTLQKGFPVLMAKRDYTSGAVHLSQRKFNLDGSSSATDKADAWYVPVSYATGEDMSRLQDTRPRDWLTPQHKDGLTLTNVSTRGSKTWLLINVQQTGYYRVNYDSANWRLLTDLLLTSPVDTLPAASRAQLVSDALNLARAGLLDYGAALNLTTYLARETAPTPWLAFMRAFHFLDEVLRDTRDYTYLQMYVRQLLRPLAQWMGREVRAADTHPMRQLRSAAVTRLLRAEDPELLQWAHALFGAWLNASADANPVPVDLRFEVYCSAARHGGVREWTALHARLEASDRQPSERSNLLRALMCTRDPHLIVTMLESSLEQDGGIRLQDAIYVWRSIDTNPVASYVAFRYVRERWDSIYSKYSKIRFILKEVIRSSVAGLTTEMDLEDTQKFLKEHESQLMAASRTVQQSLEKLRLRVHWRKHHRAQLTAWLRQKVGPTGSATSAGPGAPAALTSNPDSPASAAPGATVAPPSNPAAPPPATVNASAIPTTPK